MDRRLRFPVDTEDKLTAYLGPFQLQRRTLRKPGREALLANPIEKYVSPNSDAEALRGCNSAIGHPSILI